MRALWVVVVAAALGAAGCKGDDTRRDARSFTGGAPQEGGIHRPDRLVLGLTPYLPAQELMREYAPLANHIGNAVGIPTVIRVAEDYRTLTKLIREYEVQLAVFSPFAYVVTREAYPDIILLATHIANGSSTYHAYIVTREDSDVTRLEDLAGKRFAFVDRRSASGYLYPMAYLRSLGHEPERWFSQVTFAGNHPAVIAKVLSGEIDAGATFATAYSNAESKRLRILAKTGRIPYDAYTASHQLHHEIVAKVRQTLLDLSTRSEPGRSILGGLAHINGFVQVGDDHYAEVRRVARLVEIGSQHTP